MLSELQQAHGALLSALLELEELAEDDVPDAAKLANVRWKLSRTSGARRRLVAEACRELLATAPPGQAQRVQELQESSAQIATASSKHVGKWTLDQVLADWDGYRRDSVEMRKSMRARIAAEQAVLYPLLQPGRH